MHISMQYVCVHTMLYKVLSIIVCLQRNSSNSEDLQWGFWEKICIPGELVWSLENRHTETKGQQDQTCHV